MEDFILKYITSKLHSSWSLVSGLFLGVIAFTTIDGLFEKMVVYVNIRFLIYLLILLLWVLYWVRYRYNLQRNKKNKVGFVIAIYAESNHEEKRLKSDLISQLQKSILEQGFGDLINIIVLKNHLSEKITSTKVLKDFHKKIKGHFYLYGKVKRRNDSQKKYFLDLDGMVMHRPIDISASSALTEDFISILPKQVSFFESIEFKGFQFTANIVYLAVKYITGVAAYLSGDPHLAIKLHTNLREEFNQFKPLPPHLQKIRDKVNFLLSNEELSIARNYYQKGDLSNTESWLTKCLKTNQNNYGGLLLRAVIEFQFKKDPLIALATIKIASKHANITHEWRYSEAFLKFWIEDYDGAIKSCEKINNASYLGESATISEVEAFTVNLLTDSNITKPQLYFWLGFINYKKKNNLPESLKYFEDFERKINYPIPLLTNKSSVYIREIKREIGI